MKRARASLKDIMREDKDIVQDEMKNEQNDGSTEGIVIREEELSAVIAASGETREKEVKIEYNKIEIGNNISDKGISKSEFVKMSITIEPELFDNVDDLSRQRRRRKEPYSYSEIVREALKEYFGKNNSENTTNM
jgi:hypothetical protein